MKGGDDELRFGPFWLSRNRRELIGESGPVAVGARAFDLLVALIDRPGRLFSKTELLDLVWPGMIVEENNLHVQVASLRRALAPHQDFVQTVPGRGYRFVPPDATDEAEVSPQSHVPVVAAVQNTNLPIPLGRLVGREDELAELEGFFAHSRLVTISGPSGIGKTRLAVAIGQAMRPVFPGGVWLVDLAPLTSANLVEAAAMTALGLRMPEGANLVEVISAVIRQPALLILDNCEHLLGAAALLAEILLRGCEMFSVLCTSQEPLRVETETVFRLDPLALPPRMGGGEDVERFGAVALFVRRVAAADRRFKLNAENSAAVVDICRQLDGIPLALEMAAARVPALGIEGLRVRLGERLRLLTKGVRTAEARHRTLRDTVAWSYELLEEGDRAVFRRLGVFAGGFTVEAAVAVAADEGMDEGAVLDALGRLVDKSLVVAETGAVPRYRLLETLRLFALEQLRAGGEHAVFAQRHAVYFERFFDAAYEEWEATEDSVWLARVTPELDNARNAVEWALAGPDAAVLGVSLVGAAALLWDQLSLTDESRRYLTRAEQIVTAATPPVIAARLYRQLGVVWFTLDRPKALAALEQARVIYSSQSDKRYLGAVLALMGVIHTFLGLPEQAVTLLQEGRSLLQDSIGQKSLFNALNNLGILAFMRSEFAEARTYFEAALRISRRSGARAAEAAALVNLAEIEFNLGDIPAAVERARSAVVHLRHSGLQWDLGWALANLATYLLLDRLFVEAKPIADEAFVVACSARGRLLRACLQQGAFIMAVCGQFSDAARIIGWVDAEYAAEQVPRQPTEQCVYEQLLALLETNIQPISLQHLMEEGAAWSEDQAVTFAVDHVQNVNFSLAGSL
jgi:predicted ATPase/DNA-binding winged helix-turn-helix (wHTH) protein